ncbi:DUF885 family protein [Ferruginibacter sp. SUN106]|uniref:DUF885 family protein n=1 Tax=Ferruginibacter sp. SUN106 TaxID=2978348 RepID=UPI003D35A7D9
MKRNCLLVIVLCFLLSPHIIAQKSPTSALYAQTSEMADMMIRYDADKSSVLRFYAVEVSEGEWWMRQNNDYNSPECRQHLQQLITDYLKELEKVDFKNMNVNGKVDYLLFKKDIEDEQYKLQQQQKLYDQVAPYFTFGERIYTLEKPRRRGIAVNGESVAKELNDINKDITAAIKKLATGDSIEIKQARYAASAINSLKGGLKNYYNFYNGYDPMFTWWVPKTYTATDSLLNVYAQALKKKGRLTTSQKDDGSGIIGNPIGHDELVRQLKMEFIPYTPEDLVDIANKEFAWCDAELLKASREMGFGDNWKAAQEKVKNSFVAPGKQPEAMFDLYSQSVDFLKKNKLVTIPPLAEEDWTMFMMSPEQQRVNPFFLGGESLIVSYPTNTMTYDEKMMSMRGNNPGFSRATVHHELIAGHHLQGYMTSRYKTYRHFDTPFWVEGNALYWEMLLWDMKFPNTPEEKIGMLFWRMHRCARIIFSLNYHLGKWTPQQCIDFLVDRVGHERANAEGEVRRSFTGGYGPLYQIAYMIGGLQFMALKRELVDTHKMTYMQYHDAVLHENSLPIEMLRAILIDQPLEKDFKTTWRFYNK